MPHKVQGTLATNCFATHCLMTRYIKGVAIFPCFCILCLCVIFRSDMLELRPLQKSTTQNWTLMTWRSIFVWLLHGSERCHWRLGNSRGIYKVGEALRDEITPGKPIYFRPFIGIIITPFNNVRFGGPPCNYPQNAICHQGSEKRLYYIRVS